MRKNWRTIVIAVCVTAIVFSLGWILRNLRASGMADGWYADLARQIGRTASAETIAEPSPVPPTFEEWLSRREADSAETASSAPTAVTEEATAAPEEATAAPEEATAAPEATEEPITEEQLAEAETRAADESAADGKYAEILKSGKGMDAGTWDSIRHMLYYQWLAENGYEVPEEAEQVEQSLLMDFSELEAINSDVAGWLQSDATAINYPVAHGEDNDYYLHHLFDGTENAAGTLFTDMYNDKGFTDQNTVIYGHHMRNDTMFGTIVGYKEQAYYDEHPTMLLYTPGATYLVELFAGYTVQIDGGDHPCFQMVFENADSYAQFVADAKEKSTFRAEVAVGEADRIVTLSTCTYEVYNARYVLHGKLTLVAGEVPAPEADAEDAAQE